MPNLQRTPYDPLKDLAPVSLICMTPFALVAHPSFPAKNAGEFIAEVKANPGKYTFASSGTGATAHLFAELFNSMAGIQARHVPYKGSAPALTDVMNGNVNYAVETVAATQTHIKSGRLKAFGVTTAHRAGAMPELPPLAEAATLPGYDAAAWIGYVAPAGTPRERAQRVSPRDAESCSPPTSSRRAWSRSASTRARARPRRWARSSSASRSATARSSRARTSRSNNRDPTDCRSARRRDPRRRSFARDFRKGTFARPSSSTRSSSSATRSSTRRSSWRSRAAWESRSSIPFVKGIEGFPEVIEVKKLEHEKHNFGGIWHSDTAYLDEPPMGSMLLAREVPPYGGDTEFASQYLAYEALVRRA